MRKLILVVHTSLDGFVAGPKGELTGFDAGEENLEFVCRLTKEADAALFGRSSYHLLDTYWPAVKDRPGATWNEVAYSCWYNLAEKIVVSKTLKNKPAGDAIVIDGNLQTEIPKLKQQAGKHILVFGSPTLSHQLMELNLLDEYWIFMNPVIFGEGIPLFRGSERMKKLRLVQTATFTNGEIGLHYKNESSLARPRQALTR